METPICPWQHQRNGAAQMSWTKPSSKMWSAVDSGKVCFFLGEKPGGFQGLKPNQPTTTGKPIIAVFLEMFKLHSGWYVFCHKKDGDLPYKSLSINLQMRFWKQNTQKKTGNIFPNTGSLDRIFLLHKIHGQRSPGRFIQRMHQLP